MLTANVEQDPKDIYKEVLTKLIVRVTGTADRVKINLKNLSPDVIRLDKNMDNELSVASCGGDNNTAVVSAQRLKKGVFDVRADIDPTSFDK